MAAPGLATLAGLPGGTPVAPIQPIVDDIVLIVLIDPVCGMTVDRSTARHLAEHDGTVFAFCSIGCRTRFIKDPASFLVAPGTAGMTAADSDPPVSSEA